MKICLTNNKDVSLIAKSYKILNINNLFKMMKYKGLFEK